MNAEIFNRAFAALPEALRAKPDIAIVLGSGWGAALQCDKVVGRMSYDAIPGFGAATVVGHSGEFMLYERHGLLIAAFCGRRHRYEGIGWEQVVMPVEMARRLGCGNVLLTNAAGGINSALKPGDFMALSDHINTIGDNPLVGEHNPDWGARFPDMSAVYDSQLRKLMCDAAQQLGLHVMEGVYAYTRGPVFETPAEVRAYARMGADVVGMSTVPEAVVAHASSMKVAGLSLVTNFAAGISPVPLSHKDVIETSEKAKAPMSELIDAFLRSFAENSING